MNDRSPHGLGYIEFGEGVERASVLRYVRKASDVGNIDRAGLPSNTVWDVIPLSGTKHALVATGVERMYRAYDHLLPAESQYHVKGGIAEVNGDSIFTDQVEFITRMETEAPDYSGHVFIPGTVVEMNQGAMDITQTLYTEDEIRSTVAVLARRDDRNPKSS